MSGTPITDAEEYKTWSEGNQGMGDEYAEYVVPSSLARQLEEKLATMTAAKARALEALVETNQRVRAEHAWCVNSIGHRDDCAACEQARENDALIAKLEEVK